MTKSCDVLYGVQSDVQELFEIIESMIEVVQATCSIASVNSCSYLCIMSYYIGQWLQYGPVVPAVAIHKHLCKNLVDRFIEHLSLIDMHLTVSSSTFLSWSVG